MFSQFLFNPLEIRVSGEGDIHLRRLGPGDAVTFRDHLHMLDFHDFRDRFNGLVSDEWLDKYIERSLRDAIVLGAFSADRLVGVAELHCGGRRNAGEGESAFSVVGDWRCRGLGSLMLRGLLMAATAQGISTIFVETGPDNMAMKRLARKFGAAMRFGTGQSVGIINVADGLRLSARRQAAEEFARFNSTIDASSRDLLLVG